MLIKVKVHPHAKKTKIIQKEKDKFEISVKEKPLQGRANKAVIKALSIFLKITKDKIRIIKGHKQPNKIFTIKK